MAINTFIKEIRAAIDELEIIEMDWRDLHDEGEKPTIEDYEYWWGCLKNAASSVSHATVALRNHIELDKL